jgi:hypothetical protein
MHTWRPPKSLVAAFTAQSHAPLPPPSTHLDAPLADEGGTEELPEGHEEVAAADAAQVKGGVGVGGQQQDAPEAVGLHGRQAGGWGICGGVVGGRNKAGGQETGQQWAAVRSGRMAQKRSPHLCRPTASAACPPSTCMCPRKPIDSRSTLCL